MVIYKGVNKWKDFYGGKRFLYNMDKNEVVHLICISYTRLID